MRCRRAGAGRITFSPRARSAAFTPPVRAGRTATIYLSLSMVTRENGSVYLKPPLGWRSSFTFTTAGGSPVRVTTLTRAEAEHGWRGEAWGSQRLVISAADPMFKGDEIELRSAGVPDFDLVVFPPVEPALQATDGTLEAESTGGAASVFHLRARPKVLEVKPESCGDNKILLRFPPNLLAESRDGNVTDIYLRVDYTGDTAGAYINGQLVADHYNNGTPWVIGLKRFFPAVSEHGLVLRFRPLRKGVVKNVSNAMAARLDFEGEERLEIHSVNLIPEYTIRVRR